MAASVRAESEYAVSGIFNATIFNNAIFNTGDAIAQRVGGGGRRRKRTWRYWWEEEQRAADQLPAIREKSLEALQQEQEALSDFIHEQITQRVTERWHWALGIYADQLAAEIEAKRTEEIAGLMRAEQTKKRIKRKKAAVMLLLH